MRYATCDTRHATRLAVLLLAFALLGLVYSATTPVFEAPDEVWHYNYIRYVAKGHGLPSLQDNEHGAYQEAAQPPLYYLIAALVTAPINDDDLPDLMWHNPGFGYQSPGTSNDNKNMLVHTGRESWPWHDFTLALHLARLVALGFGTLTVWGAWGLARQVFPGRPALALVAAGVVAFTPQFVFLSGVASNDSAAAALATLALWSILALRRQPDGRRAVLTGLLIGLAWLTKTSTLLLLPLAWLVYFLDICRTLRNPAHLRHGLILTGVTLLVGGWWYVRNAVLYGDALGLSAHVNTPWGRPQSVSLFTLVPELPKVYRSFWAAFGWGHIELPAWCYVVIGLFILVSLTGWLISIRRMGMNWGWLLLLVWCGIILAALLRWMMQVEAPHGRLLFPAIGAWGVLLGAGWMAWRRLGRVMAWAGLSFLGMLALLSPWVIIRPALWPPPRLTEAQVRARADARHMVYGDMIELVGYRLSQATARPGDVVSVTLCWQSLRPMSTDYSLFVHFLGKENLVVGGRETWPGLGRFPTRQWSPGQPFCDTLHVRVEPWAPAPAVYAVEVGWYDPLSQRRLELAEISLPIVGHLVVRGAPPPSPQHAVWYDLDGRIALVGYDAPTRVSSGQPFDLILHWQAQSAPLDDYTVFVHVRNETGQLVAQHDSRPCNDTYPTSAWARGEIVADPHTFRLPAGLYSFGIGMYHQPDLIRLPARGLDGPVPDNIIQLATIQVNP